MLTLSILMGHAYFMSFYVIYITTYFTKQVLRRHTSETNKKKPDRPRRWRSCRAITSHAGHWGTVTAQ